MLQAVLDGRLGKPGPPLDRLGVRRSTRSPRWALQAGRGDRPATARTHPLASVPRPAAFPRRAAELGSRRESRLKLRLRLGWIARLRGEPRGVLLRSGCPRQSMLTIIISISSVVANEPSSPLRPRSLLLRRDRHRLRGRLRHGGSGRQRSDRGPARPRQAPPGAGDERRDRLCGLFGRRRDGGGAAGRYRDLRGVTDRGEPRRRQAGLAGRA
jgi:hypothetical protein